MGQGGGGGKDPAGMNCGAGNVRAAAPGCPPLHDVGITQVFDSLPDPA
jgi:hypothetical protein